MSEAHVSYEKSKRTIYFESDHKKCPASISGAGVWFICTHLPNKHLPKMLEQRSGAW